MKEEYERQDVCIYKRWILEDLRWRNTVGSCSVGAKKRSKVEILQTVLAVQEKKFFLACLTLEDGTDTTSRIFGSWLQTYVA